MKNDLIERQQAEEVILSEAYDIVAQKALGDEDDYKNAFRELAVKYKLATDYKLLLIQERDINATLIRKVANLEESNRQLAVEMNRIKPKVETAGDLQKLLEEQFALVTKLEADIKKMQYYGCQYPFRTGTYLK